MRPTVTQLHESGRYRLLESFRIDDMNQFVLREMGMAPKSAAGPSPRTKAQFWLFLVGMAAGGGLVGYWTSRALLHSASRAEIESVLWQAGLGIGAFFLILPIHEFIHGLAFKSVGAPKVGYGYSLKSLMVYAYSQHFPASMREMAWVAAMPFLVLTTALLAAWVIWPTYGVFWGMLLLCHTSGCMGDFALINYYLKNRRRTIYTYDDVEGERMMYFFEQVR